MYIVQKYGGTSVADKEKLELVIKKILDVVEEENKVAVVVSAQEKTTDSSFSNTKIKMIMHENILQHLGVVVVICLQLQ